MPVPSRTIDPAATTKDRLLAAAVDLLVEKGSFDQVGLRAIAAGAGVTPTAVYRHFADHAALLEAVASWCWQQFDAAVFGDAVFGDEVFGDDAPGGEPTGDDDDPVERFLARGTAYIEFARTYPGIYRVLMDHRFDDVRRVDDGLTVFAKLVAAVAEILAVRGDTRDPEYVALLVHTWIHGIATLQLPSDKDQPDVVELLSALGAALGLVDDC